MDKRHLAPWTVGLLMMTACGQPAAPPPQAPAPPPPGAQTPVAGTPGATPASAAGTPGAPSTLAPPGASVPEVRQAALVRLVTDEANPLKLDAAETEKARALVLRLLLDQDRELYRGAMIHRALGEKWAQAMPDRGADETPEATFLRNAEAAQKVLAERAGGEKATAGAWPPHLASAEARKKVKMDDLTADSGADPWEDEVPEGKQLSLMQMGALVESVAGSLDAPTATRVAAELEPMMEAARDAQQAWQDLDAMVAAAPERQEALTRAEAGVGENIDLPTLLQSSLPWVNG